MDSKSRKNKQNMAHISYNETPYDNKNNELLLYVVTWVNLTNIKVREKVTHTKIRRMILCKQNSKTHKTRLWF